MKRVRKFNYIMLAVLLLCLSACGDVRHAQTHAVDSELYSQEEIDAAINTIKKEFRMNWSGCTLTEIYYAGDDVSRANQEFADRYDADEVIVLQSSFDVDETGVDGSLNPGSSYAGWNWILVRTDGGAWKLADQGY